MAKADIAIPKTARMAIAVAKAACVMSRHTRLEGQVLSIRSANRARNLLLMIRMRVSGDKCGSRPKSH